MSKMIGILSILMAVVFLFASCTSSVEIPTSPTPDENTDAAEVVEDIPAEEDVSTDTTLTYEVQKTEVDSIDDIPYPRDGGDMVIPTSVHLRDCRPGMVGKWESRVYNSSSEAATYITTFRYPDLNNLNASAPPEDIEGWITIENPTVSMEKQSEGVFNYKIIIPENAELLEVSEFWIVKKFGQEDFVQREDIIRCYLHRGD